MGMTIDTIINDCEQRIKQSELFIKVQQKNMEIGEIKEYQYYIERDKLTIDTMRKYQLMQTDYNARLKADMVSMLEELKEEFEEYEPKWAENEDHVIASNRTWDDFDDIIQRKISELEDIK